MVSRATHRAPRRVQAFIAWCLLAFGAGLLVPASGLAALSTFGSTLSGPATLNTTENLNYAGANTNVPGAPRKRPREWSTPTTTGRTRLSGTPRCRARSRQSRRRPGREDQPRGLREPCARGPAPLTQIHFQDLAPAALESRSRSLAAVRYTRLRTGTERADPPSRPTNRSTSASRGRLHRLQRGGRVRAATATRVASATWCLAAAGWSSTPSYAETGPTTATSCPGNTRPRWTASPSTAARN